MKKEILVIFVCMLLVTIVFPNGSKATADPKTWIVDDEGNGDYTSIQSAVNGANLYDMILVYSGTYNENVIVDIPLDIIGIDKEYLDGDDTGKPIIDGGGQGNVVDIAARECTLSGFIIQNAGDGWWPNYDAGIITDYVDDITISKNVIRNNPSLGILMGPANNQHVCTNIFSNNFLDLHVNFLSNSTISGNKFSNFGHTGLRLWYCTNTEVYGCVFDTQDHTGLADGGSNNCQIHNCKFIGLDQCIRFADAPGSVDYDVFNCNFYDWDYTSVYIAPVSGNLTFYNNNFFYTDGNYVVRDNGYNNNWDMGYGLYPDYKRGNYWNVFDEESEGAYDDYQGEYQDIEGLDFTVDKGPPVGGLNPYTIQGTSGSQDTYPWIIEWDWNKPPNNPALYGPPNGKAGEEYNYFVMSTDPNDDSLYYYVDWGDGTNTSWIGLYPSGETVVVSHTWSKKGEYTVKAKTRDIFDEESDWSELEVTMPVYVGEGCLQGTQITMFSTGTPETKNIEDIRVGDYIASYDPINQVVTTAEVIEVYEFTADLPEYYLIFNDNLEVTPRHTLYIDGREWTEADDAQIGYYMLENPPGTPEINQVSISSKVETPLNPAIIKIYDLVIQPLSGEACGYWADNNLVGGYN